jgi:hypothetical protein
MEITLKTEIRTYIGVARCFIIKQGLRESDSFEFHHKHNEQHLGAVTQATDSI